MNCLYFSGLALSDELWPLFIDFIIQDQPLMTFDICLLILCFRTSRWWHLTFVYWFSVRTSRWWPLRFVYWFSVSGQAVDDLRHLFTDSLFQDQPLMTFDICVLILCFRTSRRRWPCWTCLSWPRTSRRAATTWRRTTSFTGRSKVKQRSNRARTM